MFWYPPTVTVLSVSIQRIYFPSICHQQDKSGNPQAQWPYKLQNHFLIDALNAILTTRHGTDLTIMTTSIPLTKKMMESRGTSTTNRMEKTKIHQFQI